MSDEVSRSPEDEEVMSLAVNHYLQDVHTCMPGTITEYDPVKQRVSVKPSIKRRIVHSDGTEATEEIPVIPNVPMQFPRGGGAFFALPMKKGDPVLLHFAERSIDSWASSSGGVVDPNDVRMHDLTDAIATPGCAPYKNALKDTDTANLVIGFDEGGVQAHMSPSGKFSVKVKGIADEAVALGNALQIFWDTVFTPFWIAHVHPTALGSSGPPTMPLPVFAQNIISTVMKVKSG